MPENEKNLYLICGDEEFLKLEKKRELLERFNAEGSLNFNEFSGKVQDIYELKELSETLPFMQEKRVILLSDTGAFKGSSDEDMLELINGLQEFTVLIFIESETDASNRLYKEVKKRGEIFKFVKTGELSYKEAEAEQGRIREKIKKYLLDQGRDISSRDLNDLMLLTGYDLFNIHNELEKLICYTEDGSDKVRMIRSEDIEAISSKTVSDRVFDMLNAKLSGNIKKALYLYEEMLSIKTAPMKILFMLEKQFNQVYILKELLESGATEADAAAKMELKPWLIKRLREQSRGLKKADARRYLELAAELETRVKSGDISDRLAVEILLTD